MGYAPEYPKWGPKRPLHWGPLRTHEQRRASRENPENSLIETKGLATVTCAWWLVFQNAHCRPKIANADRLIAERECGCNLDPADRHQLRHCPPAWTPCLKGQLHCSQYAPVHGNSPPFAFCLPLPPDKGSLDTPPDLSLAVGKHQKSNHKKHAVRGRGPR